MGYTNRVRSFARARVLDLTTADDLAEWDTALSPLTNLQQAGWKMGSKIWVVNPVNVRLVIVQINGVFFWYGDNCTVIPYTSTGATVVNRFITVSGANACANTAAHGAPNAISLNTGSAGQLVYGLSQGEFLVEAGASPAAVGAQCASAATGKTAAEAAADIIGGNVSRSSVTVGGVSMQRVTMSGITVVGV